MLRWCEPRTGRGPLCPDHSTSFNSAEGSSPSTVGSPACWLVPWSAATRRVPGGLPWALEGGSPRSMVRLSTTAGARAGACAAGHTGRGAAPGWGVRMGGWGPRGGRLPFYCLTVLLYARVLCCGKNGNVGGLAAGGRAAVRYARSTIQNRMPLPHPEFPRDLPFQLQAALPPSMVHPSTASRDLAPATPASLVGAHSRCRQATRYTGIQPGGGDSNSLGGAL